MSYPKNPHTIIIKNEYYPSGLKEVDIWNYYQDNKTNILRETLGKDLIIFFAIDLNRFTVIRKSKLKGPIRLNLTDYNTIISGRTVSIHSVMNRYSNFGIIDIDTDNFDQAKEATEILYDLFERVKFVYDLSIRFTGKDSFHIKIDFRHYYKIEYIKDLLNDFLIEKNIDKKYTISHRRAKNIPNIDLNRNVFNAGYITLHSLAVTGLKCIEVKNSRLRNFKKDFAKIK